MFFMLMKDCEFVRSDNGTNDAIVSQNPTAKIEGELLIKFRA